MRSEFYFLHKKSWGLRQTQILVVYGMFGLFTFAGAAIGFSAMDGRSLPEPDDPAIAYATEPTTDPVAVLNREIEAGKVRLRFDGEQGYLRSALGALGVPIESQLVVFSKTSVQAQRINPRNPRTLFFNDSVAVGWVRGGFVEVAAQDRRQGVIFYVLDQTPVEKPQFVRRNDCLTCHNSNNAMGVPGMLVRSQFTAPNGTTMPWLGNFLTDHRSPMAERWGGWYVTGETGAIRHMGNAVVTNGSQPESPVTDQILNLASLAGRFDTNAYLSPYSDIVALMVFEHQMHMMNLLTRIGWQARYLLRNGNVRDIGANGLGDSAKDLVDYMMFVDEPPLLNKIEGTSGFAEKFSNEGPHDSRGRSLRQFDLEHHLMRYPCSYMIYSAAFDGLPSEAKDAIYQRLYLVLSGAVTGAQYARLSRADRQAVLEILRETKKGLPLSFEVHPH
ncbi:MAG TPA: hypothetical protein VHM93_05715 [Candidatus Acidoferrum sp.]|jgi:hypothetical protein|nr:hypothetical protein [Candidatus Acidoferrum sp.]